MRLKLPCHPREITAKQLISSPDHLSPSLLSTPPENDRLTSAHCIAIVSSPPQGLQPRKRKEGSEEELEDAAIVLFPPDEGAQLVRSLVVGDGTGSCPSGQCYFHHLFCSKAHLSTGILYLYTVTSSSSSATPKDLLRPYLTGLSSEPLFEAYYSFDRSQSQPTPTSSAITVLEPYHGAELLTEGLDWEAEQGEKAFWAVIGGRETDLEEGKGFFDRKADEGEDPAEERDL